MFERTRTIPYTQFVNEVRLDCRRARLRALDGGDDNSVDTIRRIETEIDCAPGPDPRIVQRWTAAVRSGQVPLSGRSVRRWARTTILLDAEQRL